MAVDVSTDEVVAAAALLRAVVPSGCVGLTPYDSPRFDHFLASALSLPLANRTVLLRGCRRDDMLLAVADWRLLGSTLFLNGIAVDPAAQGSGLGRGLLADGLRLAAASGCTRVELDVDEENTRALRLYERFGFDPVTASVWTEREVTSPAGNSAAGTHCRIRNWPAFTSQAGAYGFADLDVDGPDESSQGHTIRVLPGGWRIPAAASTALVPGLAEVLAPPSRVFSVADEPDGRRDVGGPESPGWLACFRRMRLTGLTAGCERPVLSLAGPVIRH